MLRVVQQECNLYDIPEINLCIIRWKLYTGSRCLASAAYVEDAVVTFKLSVFATQEESVSIYESTMYSGPKPLRPDAITFSTAVQSIVFTY